MYISWCQWVNDLYYIHCTKMPACYFRIKGYTTSDKILENVQLMRSGSMDTYWNPFLCNVKCIINTTCEKMCSTKCKLHRSAHLFRCKGTWVEWCFWSLTHQSIPLCKEATKKRKCVVFISSGDKHHTFEILISIPCTLYCNSKPT